MSAPPGLLRTSGRNCSHYRSGGHLHRHQRLDCANPRATARGIPYVETIGAVAAIKDPLGSYTGRQRLERTGASAPPGSCCSARSALMRATPNPLWAPTPTSPARGAPDPGTSGALRRHSRRLMAATTLNPLGSTYTNVAGSRRTRSRHLRGPTSARSALMRRRLIRWAPTPTSPARAHRSRHLRGPTSAQSALMRRPLIRWAPTPTSP